MALWKGLFKAGAPLYERDLFFCLFTHTSRVLESVDKRTAVPLTLLHTLP